MNLPGILSVAQIGNSLRVLGRGGGDTVSMLEDALRKAGLAAEVRPSAPNLEDVFVAATRGREALQDRAA